ncbi:MAG: hypothetical protein AAB567_01675 [Patescibacteria group bacterium]
MAQTKNRSIFFLAGFVAIVLALSFGGIFLIQAHEDEDEEADRNIQEFIEGLDEFSLEHFPPWLERRFEVRDPSLSINPQGRVLITAGEVSEVSWPNLKVKTWGIILNVHVMGGAVIHGTGSTSSGTPQVAVGDRIDILGEMEKETGLIHAHHFKNRSQAFQEIESLRQRIQDLLKQVEELRVRVRGLQIGF